MADPVLWVVLRKYGDKWINTRRCWDSRREARIDVRSQNERFGVQHRVAKYVREGGQRG